MPRAAPCGVSSAAAAAATPRRLHHTYSRPLPRPTACERTHKHAHTHTHSPPRNSQTAPSRVTAVVRGHAVKPTAAGGRWRSPSVLTWTVASVLAPADAISRSTCRAALNDHSEQSRAERHAPSERRDREPRERPDAMGWDGRYGERLARRQQDHPSHGAEITPKSAHVRLKAALVRNGQRLCLTYHSSIRRIRQSPPLTMGVARILHRLLSVRSEMHASKQSMEERRPVPVVRNRWLCARQ